MIRAARPDEGPILSALASRSKAIWGYGAELMAAFRAELTVSLDDPTFVLEQGDAVVGFYTLEHDSDERAELGHLFVAPEHVRLGHGARLLAHASNEARRRGYRKLLIQGDPNAAAFYLRCGARPIGHAPSASVPERSLPLFELELSDISPR